MFGVLGEVMILREYDIIQFVKVFEPSFYILGNPTLTKSL